LRFIEELIIPDIKIIISGDFSNKNVLFEAKSGIEEESVPFNILTSDSDNADVLAYEGAMLSVLGVGIGLDSRGNISVHSKGLPQGKPLFKTNYYVEQDKLRATCSNAARLVKGVPFIL
jgi:hypothetical protein